MHNLILKGFGALKSFWHFLKIVCVFCVILLLLFWIQNLTHSNWSWMTFFAPFLTGLLDIANSIYSLSFNLWGAEFELKYISALIILVALYFCMNLLIMLTSLLEAGYKSTHFICKKTQEIAFNKKMQEKITKEEERITNYVVTIHTKIKPKFSHKELNVDINKQNEIMLEFIKEKLSKDTIAFEGGYMYSFNDFNNVDKVLEILFKLVKGTAPIEQAICIQVGDNLQQLQKLINLQYYGKIIMAADTSYRYRFNKTHRYKTSQVGLFQNDDKTIEVHEFEKFS